MKFPKDILHKLVDHRWSMPKEIRGNPDQTIQSLFDQNKKILLELKSDDISADVLHEDCLS